MQHQPIIFSNEVSKSLAELLENLPANRTFVLVDQNSQVVLSKIDFGKLDPQIIVIPPGDTNKNLDTLQQVWLDLQSGGATRNSLLINIGGGVVTDLGGFAAASFKRGIRFVNVPTTLLSAVDAAVGGKTGINFNGLKNEIGAFREADAVLISTTFFDSLPEKEIKSGYAEMLKHGLLKDYQTYRKLIDFDFSDIAGNQLLALLEESVNVKRNIVVQDPFEKGLRRALNLGHTAGHAFESLALHRGEPIPHGYAVAWGLVVEAVLSKMIKSLDSTTLYELADYIYRHYSVFNITCDDYDALLNYMRHDKKSEHGEYNFTLLAAPGDVFTGCVVDEESVKAALDIYRDLMHI